MNRLVYMGVFFMALFAMIALLAMGPDAEYAEEGKSALEVAVEPAGISVGLQYMLERLSEAILPAVVLLEYGESHSAAETTRFDMYYRIQRSSRTSTAQGGRGGI
jgi:hypothetical protein